MLDCDRASQSIMQNIFENIVATTLRERIGVPVLFIGLMAVPLAVPIHAQFGPLLSPGQAPQAKTQEELDAYLEIITASEPKATIQKVDQFALRYRKSDLLRVAFQYQMRAYKRTNDFEGILGAGEKALQLQPNNLNTLLTLASAIPNSVAGRSDAAELLNRAEDYARQALREMARTIIPREIPLEHWEDMRAEMEAQAHEALGHVAGKRGNLQLAISEFEKAAFNNPKPQGSQFFRLGVTYALVGKNDLARKTLSRAIDLGPDPIRALAVKERKRLNADKSTAGPP